VINHARQVLAQRGKQIIALHACLLHEILDAVLPKSGLHFLRCDRSVRTAVDPGTRDFTVSAALEILHSVADAAT
jgi:hypothetical protein